MTAMTVPAPHTTPGMTIPTVGQVDEKLGRLAGALDQCRRNRRGLPEADVLALRANLLEKADRWLDVRLQLRRDGR